MKLRSIALATLFVLPAVALLAPAANAMPTCNATTVGVGTIEVVTVRSGPECGAYAVTLYECQLKYGEAAPTHFDCVVLANL